MALNPRSQEASTTPPRLRFNFTRAKEAGASDEQIVEFLRSKDTNIDWEALQERASKQQNPLAYQVATLAQNDWSFSQAPTPTHNPQAQNAQTTTPKAPEQNLASQPSGFSTTQSNKLAALEQENGVRSFWRQFAPEFLQSQSMQQDTKFLEDSTAQAIRANTPYDKLPKALQDHIASQPQEQSFGDDLATNLAPLAIAQQIHKLTNKSERAKHHYETQQKSLAIAQKEVETLSDEDKEFIKQQASAWDKLWDSDEELYHDFIQTQRASKVVPQEMKHAMEVLDNIHAHKDFFTLGSKLLGGEENKELKQDYLNAAHTIATNLGFDGIGTNEKGELYINHEGKYYRVESGFWESVPTILAANTGSIAGSIAGAAQGARYGRALGGWGAVGGMALGGALGAAGGGALDVVFANAYLNRETTAQEVIRHATQEGALNLIADGAVLGAVKLWGKAKSLNPAGVKKLGSSIVEYTPVLGFITRAKDGNKAAAQRLLNQTYTPEQEAALKKASDEFGLALQVGSKQKLPTQDLPDPLANAIEKAQDIFTLQDQKQFQGKLLQSIRADESGNLLGFLAEAAAKSPKASQNLSQILHQTTLKLKRDLETISSKASVKGIFDELEKGTKDSYEEAMVKILGGIYDDTYKINLNTLKEASNSKSFESFKRELADAGVAPETSANFLRFVESNIYNDKGVSFTQLNNALKNLNSYYKQASDPNFKTHIKAAFDNFIRTDIKAGIDAIFSQNKAAYNDAKALFETALLDYANMKDTLKLADKLRLRDRANTEQNALKSLLDFAKGQGDKQSNIDAITKALPQSDRAHIEIAMLNELFAKATIEAKAVQVFDSAKFLNNIKELKGVFTSKSAQEYIAAASKFNELFRNDAQILQAIKPAVTDKIGSSIATSIEGAAKFQIVKAAFANIIRLMPHIPLLPQLNQKVQGAALRHHLINALESSYTISDLRLQLTQLEKRPSFNNATKELITKFKGEIDSTRDEILQAAQTKLEPQAGKEASTEATEVIHKEAKETPSTQAPAETPAPKVDSSAKSKLHPIDSQEAKELAEHFHFKGAKPLVREARENEIAHALKSHGDQATEAQRGNIAITRADIETNYPKITQEHDEKFYTDTGVIYVKQVNGHHIAIEEALLGQDKLIFKTMWKTKGNYNKEVLLKNAKASPYPHNADEAAKSESISNPSLEQGSPLQSHQSTSNSTTLSPLEQAQAPKVDSNDLQALREQTKEMLKPYTHNKITNKNDNTQAVLTSKGIAEMLSAKAIAQSVNNGFTQAQHIKAVQNIKELFTEAIYKETQEPRHPKNDVLAYRIYNANFDNANAIISVQERKINDDVVYFVKLENLQPSANARALTSTPSVETKVDNRAQRQSLPSLESHSNSTTLSPHKQAQQVESTPIADFGENFSEFRGKGAQAVEKLLAERHGQVQGAFHRDDLGEIDVVWGEVQGSGKEAKGWGLAKIIEKHLNAGDFKAFGEGEAGLINAINEIIDKGKLIKDGDRATLRYVKDGEIFKLGLKGNWHGEPTQNKWIITTYKDEREMAKTIDSSDFTKGETLPFNSSGNSTTLSPLEQAQAQKQATKAAQEAAQQAQRQAEQEAAQAIKDKNDQIQYLKDSRAGKSEMEREVKIGEPIAMQRTEQPPTSIATDDNNIYQLDFVIVKTHDVKPNFNADGLQPRTQKEHKTIESIAQNFKPEMVLGRGGYKDLPIIAKDGQVITGNHRVQGFKDFTTESRAAYEKAIKDRFNIELASDELLLRTPSDDLSVKELLSIAYNSNKEDIKNLGDHIYSVLGRYAPNFAKLPRQLESSSVQELKSKIARILDNSPYPNENDANLALLANTIKADKNANITEMLNAFSKLDKEDADKTLSTFTDTAGLWHILSNNAVEYGLKQLDLRPYLLGAMYKSAVSQHTTRAANFKELNAQIRHILDTTDSSGSNMMLEIMPNTYDNLIADLLGASLTRFMRLENPSANLYEALKGANRGIREQLAPRLDFETGFTTGKNIEQADIFDFIEYMIRQGEGGKEVNEAVELLPKLREKYEAFKSKDSALGRHSADLGDSSLSQEIKDIIDSSPAKGRDMQIIGEANFTPQVVEYAHKNNKKVAIDKLEQAEAERLGFKHPQDVRVTIDYQAINHTLNRHGAESALVKNSGQKAVDYTDIAEYRNIVKGADEKLFSKDDLGQDVILSFKQVNGYAVVVESIRKKGNELAFKSMYFENGSYKNSNAYKNAVDSQKANPSPAPYGYEPHADANTPPLKTDTEIIPQSTAPKDAPPPPTPKGLFDEVDSSVSYTDTKGHTHQIPSDIAQQWLETFGLKDLQEAYTPQFSEQVAQALEPILQGESIKLYAGSLIKLIKENRLQYLDRIKPTLEQPQRVILQNDGALIFARDFGDEKYFTSVARNDDGEWIIRSNAPKSESGLDNKIAAGGREIYNSQAATQINAHSPYDDIAKSNTKLDSTIIPQQKPYTDEKKTLQGFEQAIAGKDTHTKIQIAKEHLEYLHTPLKEQKDQLKELIKTKNFDDDEIAEALQRIETTAKPYAKKRGNIFVPFVDKPGTGWLISDKLTPLEQAKTLIAYELERENKRFFTQVSKLGDELRFLDRFKGVLQEKSAQEWHFREFDETLDFIAKELKKHDLADKDAKSYEMTYTQARDLFYKASPTQIQTELFEKVLPIAQKLGVNIRSAVRFRYENAGSDFTKDIAGMYRTNPNAATLKKGISQEIKHEVLLHELIHSVTSRAIYAYDRGQLDLLTTPQQNAIKNIKEIYAELFGKRDELGLKRWQGGEHTGDYGLKNEHEMLAELANPSFVEKLKNIGLFEKLVDNIIKLIASAKEIFGLKKTNAYERLKGELESIITNYKDDFSTQWEAQKFRDRAMGSEKVDSSKITIAQEPTEPKTLSPQEAKELLESKQGQRLPQELDIQSFLKSLESVENKENFIAHLQKKDDAQSRLAYLHIVEPTLKTPDIELTKGERKTKIKVFNDGENFYSFLIADLADKRLFTFLPKARKGYIETKIKNADLIQTFTSQASKDQEPNGLARHSIAQDSNTLLESTMKKFNYDERKAKHEQREQTKAILSL